MFGTWQDDRDDALAARLAAVGWAELWMDPALLGPAVAGGVELGRAAGATLPSSTTQTLGGPLGIDGRVRHGEGRVDGGEREPHPGRDGHRPRSRPQKPRPTPRDCRCGVPRRSPTLQASPTAPLQRRWSTHVRGSSSVRLLQRFQPCRRASPTRRSPGTASSSARGRLPRRRPGSRPPTPRVGRRRSAAR